MLHRHELLLDLELETSDCLTWYGVVNVACAWQATWHSNIRVFSEKVQGNF